MRVNVVVLSIVAGMVCFTSCDKSGSKDAGVLPDNSNSDSGMADSGAGNVDAGQMLQPDGGACLTACDCEPGLACLSAVCQPTAVAVYCCESSICPSNQFCQATDAGLSQCGSTGGLPSVDGGACATSCDCLAGNACYDGACYTGPVPVYCCDAAYCPASAFCESSAGQFGTCESDGGTSYCSLINCGSNATICASAGCGSCGPQGMCLP